MGIKKASLGLTLSLILLTLIGIFFTNAGQNPNENSRHNNDSYIKGRILVETRAGLPEQALSHILKEHKGVARRIGNSDLFIVDIPENTEASVVQKLKHHPHLRFAELDYEAQIIPDDPYYGYAWHLPKIQAPLAWDFSTGAGVIVAILDTGVDSNHPDLRNNLVPGWNFYDNNSDTTDVQGHGTKVSGAAVAQINNTVGVAGVSGNSKLMPVRIASPTATASSSTIASGIVYAADHGARVANVSYANQPIRSATLSAAQYMKDKGGLVTVSAGNNGIDEGFLPVTELIPVSATDSYDLKASWSSYGQYVMVSAPGAGIWTTIMGGGYGGVSGTSFSSPVTAGVIALMMSVNPNLSNLEIENLLYKNSVDLGDPGKDIYYGYGRVDAYKAVLAAKNATPTVDTTKPTVSIINPASGSIVSGLVPIDINSNDNIGVVKAELLVNNVLKATDSSSPFSFSWDSTSIANGTVTLTVKVYDAANNSSSASVNVSVSNTLPPSSDTTAPVVKILSPAAGATVTGSVSIQLSATDNLPSSEITLSLSIDGATKTSVLGGSLSYNWNTKSKNVKAGSHIIKATATDKAGNTSSSSITVNLVK